MDEKRNVRTMITQQKVRLSTENDKKEINGVLTKCMNVTIFNNCCSEVDSFFFQIWCNVCSIG